ncbi:hypothetical protein KM043_006655 [Ampulex compressa]|nr:hypothetical protein KM043_006655 [Ampulex compressa]
MAEVATKKSIKVVSNKKSEVCSVQSNNGLIDLDNITTSNNELISLCDNNDDDDDLILTNNTRNELDSDDKSLQELIESELALRICSSNEEEPVAETEEREGAIGEQIDTVKRIVLERREDPLDVNAEFILAETKCSALEEVRAYGYQNGHASPSMNEGTSESVKPEPPVADFCEEQNEELLLEQSEPGSAKPSAEEADRRTEEPLLELENDRDQWQEGRSLLEEREAPVDPSNIAGNEPSEETSELEKESSAYETDANPCVDKHEQEETIVEDEVYEDGAVDSGDPRPPEGGDSEPATADLLGTWTERTSTEESHQAGQFSDNFDETLCEQNQETCEVREEEPAMVEEQKDPDKSIEVKEVEELVEQKVIIDEPLEVITKTDRQESMELDGEPNALVESKRESLEEAPCTREEIIEHQSEVPVVTKNPSFEETSEWQSKVSPDAASTEEFIDVERRVLAEEYAAQNLEEDPPTTCTASPERSELQTDVSLAQEESKEETNEAVEDQNVEDQNLIAESSSELSVSESTFIEKTEVVVSDSSVTIFSETKCVDSRTEECQNLDSWTTVEEATKPALEDKPEEEEAPNIVEETVTADSDANDTARAGDEDETRKKQDGLSVPSSPRAPLATPDDETSDVSNACDSESREETITSSSVMTTSNVKGGAKTKKKKIEGVVGNDASPNLTPRTKKTKKSKKSDLEKENISVNSNLQDACMRTPTRQTHPETIDFSDEDDLSNVNVKSLTQNYVSEATRNELERSSKERIATGVSIKQLCRSFGDISNMSDGEPFGKANHAMDRDEKARSMGDLRVCEKGYSKFTKDAHVFAGVSVKALRASYCSLANLTIEGKEMERALGRPRFEKSSFNKFDALSKKTALHVRSVDASKVQQQLNAVGQNGDTNPNCRSCGKVVFQMEQTKAEGLIWHKNCFRCVQCSKQLNVDNYESHESTLYCKPHFKELFQPKPVEESDQPVRPRKPELIIRENEPKELPPDVVRASDKPDLGLQELSSLNVKSRFQVFEKAGAEAGNEIERSPSQIAVKRSPSILSKLAKFQAKGMDIGVADESLNGIPYEESSESEEEEEIEETEEVETEIVKAKRATRERPISFSKMDDIKNRWESTSQQGRREVQREARKEEIAGIRSRLFMGKQGKMKEMYQQAVAGSERVTKINAAEEIQHSTHARSIKERFERGEPIAASDDEIDSKPKPEKADEEVIAAGISRKSRSLFLELDATAAKTGRPVTPVNPKTPAEAPRRARDAFMGRQVSDDVVRSSDTTEEVQVETSDITNKFKFFESYKEPEKQRKKFRITPPRDGQVKMDSPDREIYRDPEVVRAEDRVDEVVHTDTARKMLSIFRQMEENAGKKELPNLGGPKPLKRFTPPPEDKFAKPSASDSEEEEEEGEESEADDSNEERDPNYVRASDKVEDEFLKQAQNAARAKTLCAKFEHWEETDGKPTSNPHIAEMEIAQGTGDQSSIESASSLRARFESLGSQTAESPRTPKVKVNRFVEIQTSCMDVCESCEKKVYPLEKVETNNKIFHKQCFRCLQCNCVLRMDTFTLNNGKLYCIPHFKQLFITRGNYDEGFGVDPHKNKWTTTSSNSSTSPSPIAVSNGDL